MSKKMIVIDAKKWEDLRINANKQGVQGYSIDEVCSELCKEVLQTSDEFKKYIPCFREHNSITVVSKKYLNKIAKKMINTDKADIVNKLAGERYAKELEGSITPSYPHSIGLADYSKDILIRAFEILGVKSDYWFVSVLDALYDYFDEALKEDYKRAIASLSDSNINKHIEKYSWIMQKEYQ